MSGDMAQVASIVWRSLRIVGPCRLFVRLASSEGIAESTKQGRDQKFNVTAVSERVAESTERPRYGRSKDNSSGGVAEPTKQEGDRKSNIPPQRSRVGDVVGKDRLICLSLAICPSPSALLPTHIHLFLRVYTPGGFLQNLKLYGRTTSETLKALSLQRYAIQYVYAG